MTAGSTHVPAPPAGDPAAGLLLEREIAALKTAAVARLILVAVMTPLAWALSFSQFDRLATLTLIAVYIVMIGVSMRLVARRRRLITAGLTMAVLDIILIVLMPFIWYASLGGTDLPFGFTLKTSTTMFSVLLITLNALAIRPIYPALVTAGALGLHVVLLGISMADERTTFTMSYLAAYTSSEVATGRVTADIVIVALVGGFLTVLAASARRMVIEAVRLEKANVQLGRYFSPNLVPRLVDNPDLFRVGGERRELSFVFTDLAGFTAMVESAEPAVVMPLLNDYLNEMVSVAFRHEGTVDKIVGDAVHVIFGAPTDQPDHASRALACALEMDAVAERFRRRTDRSTALGITRIGVNSGWAMVGNFGGDALFDYTAHGNAINTAARLEAANKQLGTRICVSEDTASRVPAFTGRPVGALRLRGRSVSVNVFEPLSEEQARSGELESYLAAFALLGESPAAARERFATLHEARPDDALVGFHLRRLEAGESGTELFLGG